MRFRAAAMERSSALRNCVFRNEVHLDRVEVGAVGRRKSRWPRAWRMPGHRWLPRLPGTNMSPGELVNRIYNKERDQDHPELSG